MPNFEELADDLLNVHPSPTLCVLGITHWTLEITPGEANEDGWRSSERTLALDSMEDGVNIERSIFSHI
jgi:hypothetical protein